METGQSAPYRSLVLFFILAAALTGCSGTNWLAHSYIFKAEQAFAKAYALRIKRKEVPYAQRLGLYQTACDYFWKAYEINKLVFTLSRIEAAAESCLRIENFEREKALQSFQAQYEATHPDEAKYGDAGAYMSVE